MQVIKMTLGYYDTNCYIAIEDDKCLIIDPAYDAERILGVIEEKKLELLAILCTHGHSDHIMAIEGILDKYEDLKIYCKEEDVPDEVYTFELGMNIPTLKYFKDNLELIEDNEKIKISDFEIDVITTPGHTPGSVMFIIDNYIFSGDTVFKLSIGRTDFEGGDEKDMFKSLKRIYNLAYNDYELLPGHGDNSTLGYEKKFNPNLRIFEKGEF